MCVLCVCVVCVCVLCGWICNTCMWQQTKKALVSKCTSKAHPCIDLCQLSLAGMVGTHTHTHSLTVLMFMYLVEKTNEQAP